MGRPTQPAGHATGSPGSGHAREQTIARAALALLGDARPLPDPLEEQRSPILGERQARLGEEGAVLIGAAPLDLFVLVGALPYQVVGDGTFSRRCPTAPRPFSLTLSSPRRRFGFRRVLCCVPTLFSLGV